MSLLHDETCNLADLPSLKNYHSVRPDLNKVGQDIHNALNVPRKKQQAWKRRVVSIEIKPDHLYSPREVAAVLSVSYDTATRIMCRMKRVANLAKPRAKKRLLRIKGSDLRGYIQDKLER
jgi:hypothetical protein